MAELLNDGNEIILASALDEYERSIRKERFSTQIGTVENLFEDENESKLLHDGFDDVLNNSYDEYEKSPKKNQLPQNLQQVIQKSKKEIENNKGIKKEIENNK